MTITDDLNAQITMANHLLDRFDSTFGANSRGANISSDGRAAFGIFVTLCKRMLDQTTFQLWEASVAPTHPKADAVRRNVYFPYNSPEWGSFRSAVTKLGAADISLPALHKDHLSYDARAQFSALMAVCTPLGYAESIDPICRWANVGHRKLISIRREERTLPIKQVVYTVGTVAPSINTVESLIERRIDPDKAAYGPPWPLGKPWSAADDSAPKPTRHELDAVHHFDGIVEGEPANLGTGLREAWDAVVHVVTTLHRALELFQTTGRMY